MRVTEEAPGVFAVRLFERAVCDGFVGRLREEVGWSHAQVIATSEEGGAISVSRPEVRAASLFIAPPGSEVYEEFAAKMSGAILPLVGRLWRVEFTRHSELQIVRYGPGGHYEAHTDGGGFMRERYFTVLCYLNDDFEGGATSFPSLGFTKRAASGKALIFPSNYFHRAEPVLAGEKFVMVCWVLGPVPVEWI